MAAPLINQPCDFDLSTPKRIAVIGLGNRSYKHAIPHIIELPSLFDIVVGCDKDVEEVVEWNNGQANRIDCAYVAVPHFAYEHIIKLLANAKIHVLKEKPAALSEEEFDRCHQAASDNGVRLLTASQSRYSNRLSRLREWLPFIGNTRFVEGSRTLNCVDLGEGWRAEKSQSGGGAISDVGWHLLDTIIGLVAQPDPATPDVWYSELITTRPHQRYDVDDTAFVSLKIPHAERGPSNENVSCNLRVSRVGQKKVDDLMITGTDGTLAARGEHITLQMFLASGEKHLESHGRSEEAFRQLLKSFHVEICSPEPTEQYRIFLKQDLAVIQTIQKIHDSNVIQSVQKVHSSNNTKKLQPCCARANSYTAERCKKQSTRSAKDIAKQGFQWPVIDHGMENAVQDQLHTSISIYGNDGVFQSFEQEFKEVHGKPDWFSLLHNSGSNALSALYFACNLKPGDEVIFPVYTFHATCSPAMHFGIRPIFADVSDNGNISVEAVAKAITPSTKAIVITHMWGIPCDMVALSALLQNHPQIFLLEDCSHAHGARINDQPVGTFGDGAAWSLQGQKIITGGEGGIVLTKHREFHIRQLLWGHYNKRCKLEIPSGHPLRHFATTGSGVKNRAHPLAVRIALDQLRKLPSIHKNKSRHAAQMIAEIGKIPFLEPPTLPPLTSSSSTCTIEPAFYALTFLFKPLLAPPGLTREIFVRALVEKYGLVDVDIPKSTGLLHNEPLFTHPHVLLPHVYRHAAETADAAEGEALFRHNGDGERYGKAQRFFDEVIKVPVWAGEGDEDDKVVDWYIRTFRDVAAEWERKEVKEG